jgi:hypothetical protein
MSLIAALATKASVEAGPVMAAAVPTAVAVVSWAALTVALPVPGSVGTGAASFFWQAASESAATAAAARKLDRDLGFSSPVDDPA